MAVQNSVSPFQHSMSACGAGSFHKSRSGTIAVYIRSILKLKKYTLTMLFLLVSVVFACALVLRYRSSSVTLVYLKIFIMLITVQFFITVACKSLPNLTRKVCSFSWFLPSIHAQARKGNWGMDLI